MPEGNLLSILVVDLCFHHRPQVNRIRELPQDSKIVATHTDSPDVLIWNVESQPNRNATLGVNNYSRPDLVLTGHQDNAEFALAMGHSEPFVLSGGKDKSVVLWSIHDHVSTLAADQGDAKSPGSGASNPKPSADGPTVQARGIFQGHDDTVEDVQFCPFSAQEFCSVGDDSCLILWDARTGWSPVVKVEKAHNADLHCVDWNPHDVNYILTGSADNTVRLFDRRNLTSGGVGSPIHIFEAHTAAVLCVQWSPDKSSVFGSSAEDGILNIWDHERVRDPYLLISFLLTFPYGPYTEEVLLVNGENLVVCNSFNRHFHDLHKIGKMESSAGTKRKTSPPGLFFCHAGHRDKVVDFHWNVSDPWTIVSVSDDGEKTGGGGTLQIWRMIDLIYRPHDEVLSELEKFKSHLLTCT
ncbi:WD-40 repeat-containing protein MSI5 [Capsicum annuum]|nr:WD-40 repeat-containing protein MSI5 [Capsicum annuum]